MARRYRTSNWGQCPRCKSRAFLTRPAVYRCQVCFQHCCDYCARRSWGRLHCPHCMARGTLAHVGYV